jgi:hypothetical protein
MCYFFAPSCSKFGRRCSGFFFPEIWLALLLFSEYVARMAQSETRSSLLFPISFHTRGYRLVPMEDEIECVGAGVEERSGHDPRVALDPIAVRSLA